jgi:hypothetical protein
MRSAAGHQYRLPQTNPISTAARSGAPLSIQTTSPTPHARNLDVAMSDKRTVVLLDGSLYYLNPSPGLGASGLFQGLFQLTGTNIQYKHALNPFTCPRHGRSIELK